MKYKIIDNTIYIKIDNSFANQTLLDFLNYYQISKRKRYLYTLEKRILINNKIANYSDILKLNDTVKIIDFASQRDFVPASTTAKVVYEDDFYLVVHKDNNLIIHTDDKSDSHTLASQVSRYYLDSNQSRSIRYIHRLDRDTSGLVVFNKQAFFEGYSNYLLASKLIKRYYLAYCFNQCQKKTFDIERPIARDRHTNKMRISKNGKYAHTHCECLKNVNGYSLIECVLDTGRTHQIRVHLASIDHPIVNDVLYSRSSDMFMGMGLNAYKVILINPMTNENIIVKDNYFKLNKLFI